MARKPRAPAAVFTDLESFLYLLTELELAVGAGKIQWSTASAIAAERRLGYLVAMIRQVISRLETQ